MLTPSVALRSAPLSRNNRTTSRWPFSAEWKRAGNPCYERQTNSINFPYYTIRDNRRRKLRSSEDSHKIKYTLLSNPHILCADRSVRVLVSAYIVRSIRVGASVQEQLNHLQTTILRGADKGGTWNLWETNTKLLLYMIGRLCIQLFKISNKIHTIASYPLRDGSHPFYERQIECERAGDAATDIRHTIIYSCIQFKS